MDEVEVLDECALCFREGTSGFERQKPYVRHGKRYVTVRCSNRAACERRQAHNKRQDIRATLDELRDRRENLALVRQEMSRAEQSLAFFVREALKEGAGATEVAKAAGLSRERVYQIKAGRR